MKTIYFVRCPGYNYHLPNKTLYESFDVTARRQVDPHLSKMAKSLVKNKIKYLPYFSRVYYSPSRRTRETAQLISHSLYEAPELAEILYSMTEVISENKFLDKNLSPQVDKARRAFVDALIGNRLTESYQSLMTRLTNFTNQLLVESNTSVLCLSHGFVLKVLESLLAHPEIVAKPEDLKLYFPGDTITYRFGSGFMAQFGEQSVTIKPINLFGEEI